MYLILRKVPHRHTTYIKSECMLMNFSRFRSHFISLAHTLACSLSFSSVLHYINICRSVVVEKNIKWSKQKDVIDHWITDFSHKRTSRNARRREKNKGKSREKKHIVLMFGFVKMMFLWMQKKKVLEKSLIATFRLTVLIRKHPVKRD